VIDQLTSLPKKFADRSRAFPHASKLHIEGGGSLFSAALTAGAKRYIQQSSGFYLKPKVEGLATDEDSFQVDASQRISFASQRYCSLEERLLRKSSIDGLALR